jgi:hypothetical protein
MIFMKVPSFEGCIVTLEDRMFKPKSQVTVHIGSRTCILRSQMVTPESYKGFISRNFLEYASFSSLRSFLREHTISAGSSWISSLF